MLLRRCKDMRCMVVVSGVLFFLGIVLQVLINIFQSHLPNLPSFFPYLGFIFIIIGPIILLVAVVVSTLSKVAKNKHSGKH